MLMELTYLQLNYNSSSTLLCHKTVFIRLISDALGSFIWTFYV